MGSGLPPLAQSLVVAVERLPHPLRYGPSFERLVVSGQSRVEELVGHLPERPPSLLRPTERGGLLCPHHTDGLRAASGLRGEEVAELLEHLVSQHGPLWPFTPVRLGCDETAIAPPTAPYREWLHEDVL